MIRTRAIIAFLLFPIVAGGCSWPAWLGIDGWRPTKGSEAVDYTPGQGLSPASSPGYVDGDALNARKR